MISMTSLIIIGIIALISIFAVWKLWKTPGKTVLKDIDTNIEPSLQNIPDPPQNSSPPPMVFAVNIDGELDLTDMSGKILNIAFGHNQKVYINLLDSAEKDISKENGVIVSKVGTTKYYEVGGRPYIINYTRLDTL